MPADAGSCGGAPLHGRDTARRLQGAYPAAPGGKSREKQGQYVPKRRSRIMKYQVQENCLTIYLPREVDHHNAEEMKREADAVIDRNHIKYVIFDFERTDFMDSSGIGVIMGRYKTICLIGGEVWAVHANARIKKILTLSGVTKIMKIYEEDEA
jgi:stage II sporulation protein AA (anti-sigma F factor antagonist)